MKVLTIKKMLVAAVATLALAIVACGGDDDGDAQAAGDGNAAGGGTTISVTQSLLDSLPEYDGATLVSEWLTNGNTSQVRQYAVAGEPAQMADTITRFYRDALVAAGWTESEAHAAVSPFSKDGRQIILGRVGPEQQAAPSGATILNSADAPAGTGFYFTLEASEE